MSGGMKIQSDIGFQTHSSGVITEYEATRLVQDLKKFSIEEYGSRAWLNQHDTLEKLNLQAHHNVVTNTDPFVLESLISFDQISTVIHDLLLTEAWKEHVAPKIENELITSESVKGYLYMYHEATVVNLLEVLFFHQSSCESAGER
eukprot:TRINITY_DN8944_c0_g1_i2.p2 TRINITY_DN8944_c0_g1~~TRINITY_DN8944_c0_g1_i2.p2  ORF type:complete len:146 (+),score=18.64 TRINITY_DN8944_c0_g1_i2:238-675(+)